HCRTHRRDGAREGRARVIAKKAVRSPARRNGVPSPLWGRASEGGRAKLCRLSSEGQIGKRRATPTPTRPHKGGGSACADAHGDPARPGTLGAATRLSLG